MLTPSSLTPMVTSFQLMSKICTMPVTLGNRYPILGGRANPPGKQLNNEKPD